VLLLPLLGRLVLVGQVHLCAHRTRDGEVNVNVRLGEEDEKEKEEEEDEEKEEKKGGVGR
jgi:hypothetical protein